ncbi:MAG: ABC transporter ATP-binding protein [Melioribacteraceae bacterium]|nr:ABC transporter ATP-binding protein [Melioribacteraceae bacterium]
MNNIVEINHLKFSYPHQNGLEKFQLSIEKLEIAEADFISLIGPNGCGKSTLLKLISRMIKPEKGEIRVYDKDLFNYNHKQLSKLISYVPQNNYSVFPYSVYEIVMMGRFHNLSLLGFESGDDVEIVKSAMNEMQVYHLAKKGIKELSGGEAQRVFIARAIAQQSKMILLDEPTSHLDIEHQIMIFEKLSDLNSVHKRTIITVSHDLNLVANFSKRIILMMNGEVKLDGNKKSVLNKQNIKEYFNVETEIINYSENDFNIIINPKK